MVLTADFTQRLRQARFVRRRAAERAAQIGAALCSAQAGCVVLAGNSHAEFLGTPEFGGRRSVNLGIGGSTAGDCARHLAGLHLHTRAAAAVMLVGTNDILRCRRPDRARSAHRFADDAARILAILESWAAQVFVAAVPPVGARAKSRDPAAVGAFSGCLRDLCARGGHTFFDPFASLRDGDTGLALTGLHPDGVHLADYDGLCEDLVRFVGRHLVLPQAKDGRRVTMPTPAGWCPPPRPGWTAGALIRAASRPVPPRPAPATGVQA